MFVYFTGSGKIAYSFKITHYNIIVFRNLIKILCGIFFMWYFSSIFLFKYTDKFVATIMFLEICPFPLLEIWSTPDWNSQ